MVFQERGNRMLWYKKLKRNDGIRWVKLGWQMCRKDRVGNIGRGASIKDLSKKSHM